MGEVLGVGLTHYPGPMVPDAYMADFLRHALASNRVPAETKQVQNWPAAMQAEWGADESAGRRGAVIARGWWTGFRRVRREIEAFAPDFMVIWGDDQYENFREDIVPAVLRLCAGHGARDAAREHQALGAAHRRTSGANRRTRCSRSRGHPDGAKFLVRRLHGGGLRHSLRLRRAPRTSGLAHSFDQHALFLDYDRTGFDIPLVPFHVNCYGSSVVRSRGGGAHLADGRRRAARSPRPEPRALLRARAHRRARAAGQPLAGGARRLVQLVARLPDREELLALSRRGGGPPAARRATGGAVHGLGRPRPRAGRGRRPA